MERYFNTAGPCIPGVHYMLPAEARLTEARRLVERGMFFLLHAPRQVGKTTLINGLARALNAEGTYAAMVFSVEHLCRVPSAIAANMERLQLSKGYLVLFDQRPEVSWDDKLFDVEVPAPGGQTIHIFGA